MDWKKQRGTWHTIFPRCYLLDASSLALFRSCRDLCVVDPGLDRLSFSALLEVDEGGRSRPGWNTAAPDLSR